MGIHPSTKYNVSSANTESHQFSSKQPSLLCLEPVIGKECKVMHLKPHQLKFQQNCSWLEKLAFGAWAVIRADDNDAIGWIVNSCPVQEKGVETQLCKAYPATTFCGPSKLTI
jgi:hypothetical protein